MTVAAAEDDADFDDDQATFTHTASSTDGNYGATLAIASITATATDNDVRDTTAPTVVSVVRHDGASALARRTNAETLTFRVTFSEAVENVDEADFDAAGTTGDATGVTGSGAEYVVTLSGGDLDDYEGEVGLALASDQDIADEAGNALADTGPSGTDHVYLVDTIAPTVVSVERDDGTGTDPGEHTNADTIRFRVTFSEAVRNANASDFAATGTNAGVSVVGERAPTAIDLAVSGGNLGRYEGEVALILHATRLNIEDLAGNALDTTLPSGTDYETYTLDNTAPTATLTVPESYDGSAAFNVGVTFSEDVSGFDAVADLALGGGSLAGGATDITRNDARTYTVRVTPSGTGNVTVSVPADAAEDDAGNGNAGVGDRDGAVRGRRHRADGGVGGAPRRHGRARPADQRRRR